MKKFIYAAGALTAGAATLCQPSTARAEHGGRPWSISAAVKGFYDSNIYTAPDEDPVFNSQGQVIGYEDNGRKQDSFGIDISPGIRLDLPLEQGNIGLGYQFGMRWYEAREDDQTDYYHFFNADFTHQFSPRYKLTLFDSLAIAQEPEQLSGQSSTGGYIPFRSRGDNLRNNAGAEFTAQINDPASVVLSYYNNLYDFTDNAGSVDGIPLGTGNYGELLDRMEQLIGASFRYQILPKTLGLVGYQYGITEYDHDEREYANNTAHYLYAGVEHNFTSTFTASLRLGARMTDFDEIDQDSTTPYVDFNVRYNYRPDSYGQLGLRTDRMATDVAFVYTDGGATFITDTQTTSVYGLVTHAFTPKFKLGLIAQFQWSEYRYADDDLDGDSETFFGVGATLSYQFTHWLAAEANYYFDDRNSEVYGGEALDYVRHRVFLGVRFIY